MPAQKEYECVGTYIDVCAHVVLYVNHSVIRKINTDLFHSLCTNSQSLH